MSKYHIVYPSGDKSKLAVVEICEGLEYELSDYSLASRQSFVAENEAKAYAKFLAKNNDKEFVSSSVEEDFLD